MKSFSSERFLVRIPAKFIIVHSRVLLDVKDEVRFAKVKHDIKSGRKDSDGRVEVVKWHVVELEGLLDNVSALR